MGNDIDVRILCMEHHMCMSYAPASRLSSSLLLIHQLCEVLGTYFDRRSSIVTTFCGKGRSRRELLIWVEIVDSLYTVHGLSLSLYIYMHM